jgi:hypothetical protein
MRTVKKERANCVIVYATETGKSEQFALALFKSIKQRMSTKVGLNNFFLIY